MSPALDEAPPDAPTIPFGAQFSPNQVDLPTLLRIIHDHAGNRVTITATIRDRFFATHASSRETLALNTVLAMREYGLLEEDRATPSPLANELLAVAPTSSILYERFAKHILVNLQGSPFMETVQMK